MNKFGKYRPHIYPFPRLKRWCWIGAAFYPPQKFFGQPSTMTKWTLLFAGLREMMIPHWGVPLVSVQSLSRTGTAADWEFFHFWLLFQFFCRIRNECCRKGRFFTTRPAIVPIKFRHQSCSIVCLSKIQKWCDMCLLIRGWTDEIKVLFYFLATLYAWLFRALRAHLYNFSLNISSRTETTWCNFS